MDEIYISVDIEADGKVPGLSSMLSVGAAAFRLGDRTPVDTFEVNLEQLPGPARPDPDTMAWWQTQPEAWAVCRRNVVSPDVGMRDFVGWCRRLPGKPVLVGYPITYDFMWVYWYTVAFGLGAGERCPFGFAGLDLKTLAFARQGGDFRAIGKRTMPRAWFEGAHAHTHVALDDALGQGVLFVNLMAELRPEPSA